MSGPVLARGELAGVDSGAPGTWEDEWYTDELKEEFDGFLKPLQYFMMTFLSAIEILTRFANTPIADIAGYTYQFGNNNRVCAKGHIAHGYVEGYRAQLEPELPALMSLFTRQVEEERVHPECRVGPLSRITRLPDGSFEVKSVYHICVDVNTEDSTVHCSMIMYIGTDNVLSFVITPNLGSLTETLDLLWKTDLPTLIRPTPGIHLCVYCKRIVATKMSKCADCKVARYCNRTCQKKDRPAHKGQQCSELLAERLAQKAAAKLAVRDDDEPAAARGEGGAGA